MAGKVPGHFAFVDTRKERFPYGTFELATFPNLLYDISIFSWDRRKSPSKRQIMFVFMTEVAI